MVAKVAFLVLLGTALVLANPVSKVADNELTVESSMDRSIEEAWKKLESKFSKAIDEIKATWETVKEKGQKVVNVNLKNIKEKGVALIQKAKEVYKQIVIEGKAATPELQGIYNSLKTLTVDLKQLGSEAVGDAKQLVQEVVDTVKQEIANLKQ